MYGTIPATNPMLKASGIVNLNKVTKINRVISSYCIKAIKTMIEFVKMLELPYVSMYVKQDDVEPSFFELLKRQIRN